MFVVILENDFVGDIKKKLFVFLSSCKHNIFQILTDYVL